MSQQHPPSAQDALEQWKKATLTYTTEGRSGNVTKAPNRNHS